MESLTDDEDVFLDRFKIMVNKTLCILKDLTIDNQIKGFNYLLVSINIIITTTFAEEFYNTIVNNNKLKNGERKTNAAPPATEATIRTNVPHETINGQSSSKANTITTIQRLLPGTNYRTLKQFSINEIYYQNFKIDIKPLNDNNLKVIINHEFVDELMNWMISKKTQNRSIGDTNDVAEKHDVKYENIIYENEFKHLNGFNTTNNNNNDNQLVDKNSDAKNEISEIPDLKEILCDLASADNDNLTVITNNKKDENDMIDDDHPGNYGDVRLNNENDELKLEKYDENETNDDDSRNNGNSNNNNNTTICDNKNEQPFVEEETIAIEKKIVKKRKIIEFPCLQCDKIYRKRKSLIIHYQQHTGHCPDCGDYRGSKSEEIIAHNKLRHLKQFPFICEICGESFGRNQQYLVHTKAHETDSKQVLKCSECNEVFYKARLFKKHLYDMGHIDTRKICEYCGKQFGNENALLQHLRRSHQSPTLQCAYCPKKFSVKNHLDIHVRLHKEITKTFICEECGSAFFTHNSLTQHKLIHTSLEYKCDLCSKIFPKKRALERHKVIHCDDRPYSCTICSQTFKHKTNLRRHNLSVHSIQPNARILKRIAPNENGEFVPVDLPTKKPKKNLSNNSSGITNNEVKDDFKPTPAVELPKIPRKRTIKAKTSKTNQLQSQLQLPIISSDNNDLFYSTDKQTIPFMTSNEAQTNQFTMQSTYPTPPPSTTTSINTPNLSNDSLSSTDLMLIPTKKFEKSTAIEIPKIAIERTPKKSRKNMQLQSQSPLIQTTDTNDLFYTATGQQQIQFMTTTTNEPTNQFTIQSSSHPAQQQQQQQQHQQSLLQQSLHQSQLQQQLPNNNNNHNNIMNINNTNQQQLQQHQHQSQQQFQNFNQHQLQHQHQQQIHNNSNDDKHLLDYVKTNDINFVFNDLQTNPQYNDNYQQNVNHQQYQQQQQQLQHQQLQSHQHHNVNHQLHTTDNNYQFSYNSTQSNMDIQSTNQTIINSSTSYLAAAAGQGGLVVAPAGGATTTTMTRSSSSLNTGDQLNYNSTIIPTTTWNNLNDDQQIQQQSHNQNHHQQQQQHQYNHHNNQTTNIGSYKTNNNNNNNGTTAGDRIFSLIEMNNGEYMQVEMPPQYTTTTATTTPSTTTINKHEQLNNCELLQYQQNLWTNDQTTQQMEYATTNCNTIVDQQSQHQQHNNQHQHHQHLQQQQQQQHQNGNTYNIGRILTNLELLGNNSNYETTTNYEIKQFDHHQNNNHNNNNNNNNHNNHQNNNNNAESSIVAAAVTGNGTELLNETYFHQHNIHHHHHHQQHNNNQLNGGINCSNNNNNNNNSGYSIQNIDNIANANTFIDENQQRNLSTIMNDQQQYTIENVLLPSLSDYLHHPV